MRELTVLHSVTYDLCAFCGSVALPQAQLRGILEKLSHEAAAHVATYLACFVTRRRLQEQAEAQHAALNESCHPLVVASLQRAIRARAWATGRFSSLPAVGDCAP